MDLTFSADELAFRDEIRAFLRTVPSHLTDKVRHGVHLTRANMGEWHALLNAKGWLATHWPTEHGGPGWGTVQKFIFDHECALAYTPRTVAFGLSMLGPVLIKYGNEQQKRH